jgi:hypothetical protein
MTDDDLELIEEIEFLEEEDSGVKYDKLVLSDDSKFSFATRILTHPPDKPARQNRSSKMSQIISLKIPIAMSGRF